MFVANEMEGEEKVGSGPLPNGWEPVRFRLLILVCAAFVAGVGVVALLGWVLELPVLASLGSAKMPVAPSTAVLFVLYAVAVLIRAHLPVYRWTYWTGLSINATGALLAALLFVLSLFGIRTEAEHLGFDAVNTHGDLQVGHMSPVAAFCFLLSSLSYLLSLPSSHGRRLLANISWWLACSMIATGSTLVLAYLYGTPILYGSAFIPPAALTSVAFMALGTALLALAVPHARPSLPNDESTTRASYTFLLVFVLLAAGIVLAGFLYYRNYQIRYRTEVEHQLAAVADLKVDGLVLWRKERLGDASLFYKNFDFSGLVQRYLEKPGDEETGKKLRAWLQHVREGYQYDRVFLLDADSRERMSEPEARRPISRSLILRAAEALRTKQVTFEDFYRNEYDGRVYLAALITILDKRDNGRAVGTLVLRIDPEKYLYPFINRWPTPSLTAETLLVRREGNETLFLNELRFQKNTALNLHESLDQKELPAVQAVLGRQGIMEGKDYRGVPVIADVRAVPGSPWFLISHMDVSEVYGPMREKLWTTAVLVITLLTSAGAAIGMVWRRQRTQFYREKYETFEALRASEERYRNLFNAMGEGFCIIEMIFNADGRPIDYRFLEVNAAFEKQTGLHEAEGKLMRELAPAHEAHWVEIYGKIALSGEPAHFVNEATALNRWYDVYAYRVGSPEDLQVAIVFNDITDRKNKEREIERKNAELERFTYTVSHDLKSPLVTVKTFLGYLQEDMATADTERIEKDMGYIRTAAEKMGHLLDELLEMSRVGRVVSPPVTVSFRELVNEALNAVAGSIAERKVEVHVSDEAITLYGDRPRLVEIWQNLVENAVKFMGNQTLPRIEIGVEHDGPATIFFVRDNGVGIDPRYKEKVFGLFEKLDPKAEGTGLGLALVKRIVELYKGKIWLESEGPGTGACFLFTLPEAINKQDKGGQA